MSVCFWHATLTQDLLFSPDFGVIKFALQPQFSDGSELLSLFSFFSPRMIVKTSKVFIMLKQLPKFICCFLVHYPTSVFE